MNFSLRAYFAYFEYRLNRTSVRRWVQYHHNINNVQVISAIMIRTQTTSLRRRRSVTRRPTRNTGIPDICELVFPLRNVDDSRKCVTYYYHILLVYYFITFSLPLNLYCAILLYYLVPSCCFQTTPARPHFVSKRDYLRMYGVFFYRSRMI